MQTPPPGTPPTLNLVGKSCVTAKAITMTLKGTAKPTGGSSSGVLVAPYVDMGVLSNGGTLSSLASGGNVKSFSLAFVTAAGCKASWFGAFDPRAKQFADQISAVRAAGGDVKVSFGGATGIELAQACTDVKALQARGYLYELSRRVETSNGRERNVGAWRA